MMMRLQLAAIAMLGFVPFIIGQIAGSNVCIQENGGTILCPLHSTHSPTGYANGVGWAVNADGSMYYDAYQNRVIAG